MPGVPGDGVDKRENPYRVKAAYLYYFARLTSWPEEAFNDEDTPIVIAVLGKDPFGPYLDNAIEGKVINGRKLVIKRLKELPPQELYHILFISASEKERLEQILQTTEKKKVLTVSEMDQFAETGGIINFIMVTSPTTKAYHVHMRINLQAAARSNLKISSQLTKLKKVKIVAEKSANPCSSWFVPRSSFSTESDRVSIAQPGTLLCTQFHWVFRSNGKVKLTPRHHQYT